MIRERMLLAAAFVAIMLLGFFQFPGHTILQSDTQIYLPIIERLWDPSALSRDLVAANPHVSYTIYDEATLLLHAITRAGFENALIAQQLIYRTLGIWGLYLIATALGLSVRMALLFTALLSLGATISGPAVLIVEYEPVPRGFAVPLLILSLGLMLHN